MGYDGSGKTSWLAGELTSGLMHEITHAIQERPDLVLAAWPEVVGSQLASMTTAVSFLDGVLSVKVRNATLFSLLNQREKGRILAHLRSRFPKMTIANIVFRMG
jgi:hypothetical protein